MPDPLQSIRRREFLQIFGGAAAALLTGDILSGCGGGSGSGGGGESVQPSVVIKSSVVPLATDGSITVASATKTQIVLTGKVPALVPGSVIVSGTGNGLIAKVTSVSTSGATTTAQVTEATLEDIFGAATITLQKDLAFTDLDTITTLLPGVTITAPTSRSLESGPLQRRGSGPGTFQANYAQVQVSSDIAVNGSATVDFALNNSIVLDGQGIKSAMFVPSVTASGTLEITGTITVETSIKVRYAHIVGVPQIVLIEAGPIIVPVLFQPVFDLYFLYDSKQNGVASFSATGSATISAGLQYDRGSGWAAVTPTPSTSFTTVLSTSFQAGLSVTPVHLEFSELIYGIVGPTVVVDLPTLGAEFTIDPASHSVPGDELSCTAALDLTAGYTVQVLGKTLQDSTLPGNLSKTFTIFDEFYPDSDITIRAVPRGKKP